jgi:hypothetical protein
MPTDLQNIAVRRDIFPQIHQDVFVPILAMLEKPTNVLFVLVQGHLSVFGFKRIHGPIKYELY